MPTLFLPITLSGLIAEACQLKLLKLSAHHQLRASLCPGLFSEDDRQLIEQLLQILQGSAYGNR